HRSPAYRVLEGFFLSNTRRHTGCYRDWSSDVCSSDLSARPVDDAHAEQHGQHRGVDVLIGTADLGEPDEVQRGQYAGQVHEPVRSEERRVGTAYTWGLSMQRGTAS